MTAKRYPAVYTIDFITIAYQSQLSIVLFVHSSSKQGLYLCTLTNIEAKQG